MGRAKERGTLEERIAQSRANAIAKEERRKAEAKEWWDSLTDEEKEEQRKKWAEQRKKVNEFHTMMAIAQTLGR